MWDPGRTRRYGSPFGRFSITATVSTSSPRIISIDSKVVRSSFPSRFFTPGIKRIGSGHTSSMRTLLAAFARSSADAGATTWGISVSPTLDVIIPEATTLFTFSYVTPACFNTSSRQPLIAAFKRSLFPSMAVIRTPISDFADDTGSLFSLNKNTRVFVVTCVDRDGIVFHGNDPLLFYNCRSLPLSCGCCR